MKKSKFILPITAFALLLSLGLSACNNSNNAESKDEPKTQESAGGDATSEKSAAQEKITITAAGDKKTLKLGETVQLTASVEGVTWKSSDDGIVTVKDGLVTAVGKGSTTVKASKDGYKDGSISIKVELEKITITAADNKTSLLIAETVQLSASQEGVTWTSSDENVATVNNGLVTAVKLGSVTIKASKANFDDGSITINVVRPDPTAVLHFENAAHYSADGEWINSNRGPGETPIYEKSAASDGTCVGYFGEGDKETLTFTSSAAVKAELVITMGHNSSFESLATIYTAKFNDVAIDLTNVAYASDTDGQGGYTFQGVSFGEFDLVAGNNVLEIGMLGNAPYLDDLQIYAASAATIAVVPAPDMLEIDIEEKSLTVEEGSTVQIVCKTEGVSYTSSSEANATVDDKGLVTGVAKGSVNILVKKDGYKTAKVAITVTEKLVEGEIRLQAEDGKVGDADVGTDTPVVIRSTSTGETCTAQWAQDAVLVIKGNVVKSGLYELSIVGRAGGQYGTANIDDLSTVIEVKVNNATVTVPAIAISGRTFTKYVIGDVTLAAGEVTVEIKGLGANTAPNIDFVKLTPKAS